MSEIPLVHRAKAQDFPHRNRVITGLARGTVVVEAAGRPGSLISARVANDLDREVMAVPGSRLDPRAAGTSNLIHNDAALLRHAGDVLEVLSSLTLLRVSAPPPDPYDAAHGGSAPIRPSDLARVREALSPQAMPLDESARAAGVSAARAGPILMELERAREAVTVSGGMAARGGTSCPDMSANGRKSPLFDRAWPRSGDKRCRICQALLWPDCTAMARMHIHAIAWLDAPSVRL